MGYSYSGVIDGLKEFYSSMRKLNVEIGAEKGQFSIKNFVKHLNQQIVYLYRVFCTAFLRK